MSNKELYQATFAQVHSHATVKWEDCKKRRRMRQPARILAIAAVVACLLAAFSVVAVAVNFLGIRDLLMPDKQNVGIYDEDGIAISGEAQQVDTISLSGYMDTPESQALAEWAAFLGTYDKDHAILNEIGNGPTGLDSRYDLYGVYTQEMADNLDEIVGRYELKLHTTWREVLSTDEWEILIGGDFLGENDADGGYIYEDGTFHLDGAGFTEEHGLVHFQLQRAVKGSFQKEMLNITDSSAYQEWVHQTPQGQSVTLALGPSKALLLLDLNDSFVSVNVLEGSDQQLTGANLEALADSFDFSALQPVKPLPSETELANRLYRNILLEQGQFFEVNYGKHMNLNELLRDTWEQVKVAKFTVIDLDGDGVQEVVLWEQAGSDDSYGFEILHMEADGVGGYNLPWRSFLDLKEDGTYSFSGNQSYYGFGRIEFLTYDMGNENWQRTWVTNATAFTVTDYLDEEHEETHYTHLEKPVTKEEFQALWDAQKAKKDAVWYDFTEKQVKAALPLS